MFREDYKKIYYLKEQYFYRLYHPIDKVNISNDNFLFFLEVDLIRYIMTYKYYHKKIFFL